MVPGVRVKLPFARESSPANGVVSVRQAVCDASRAVIGYEVLTGDPDAPPASARFCARALLEAFTDVDLDLVAPHHPAYLTVAPALLLRLDMLPVAPDRVVLQLETATAVHEEVVAAVTRLAGFGYAFAAVDPPTPASVAHLPEIGLVRLDTAGIYPVNVAQRVRPFLDAGLEVHAVGVESFQVFEACIDAGCHAFQGPFRALPALGQTPAVELGAMATAGELLAPDLDSERLEALIARDLELSYRLLRYANSAFFSRRREIGTVRDAITLIGERMTRRWALVVALAGGGPRPDELLTDALVRARTMELVAKGLPGLSADHAFTVGLFSMLPSLVNRPMEYALGGLGLPADIQDALLDGRPPYGALLDRLICHLDGAFAQGEGASSFARIDEAYRSALAWVEPLRDEVERGTAATAA
jgi:EAL and modified HD-GYP domain-containing signal transduction protein